MQQGIRNRAAGVAVAAASALALGLTMAPSAAAGTTASDWRTVARTGSAIALAHVPGTDATVAVVQLGNGTIQLHSEVVATGTLPR